MMFRPRCSMPFRALSRIQSVSFSSSSSLASQHLNAPLDIDPTFKALLKDVDMSLLRHKSRHHHADETGSKLRELEVYPDQALEGEETLLDEEGNDSRTTRKSPAAHFGSQSVGAVVLPHELQNSVQSLISESDKRMLRNDAKRLFLDEESGADEDWDATYDVEYRSRKQAAHHSERDGTAFASIALPAHYSAIYAVLDHARLRLGSNWNVETVLDWGAGTGSGLWAAAHVFQKGASEDRSALESRSIADSTIANYVGVDKREGLLSIGKRLIQAVGHNQINVSWQRAIHNEDKVLRVDGGNTLALSAFLLSSLSTPLQRKAVVKELWESGAEVIILIDHNTRLGFQGINEAREYLLNMGSREVEDPNMKAEIKGCHVVAPCPHDGACPLYHSNTSKLVCGFSQRLQRPDFVRKTKHSGTGHEDIGYSYVVIRRGSRPVRSDTKVGRLGEVGKRELQKLQSKAPVVDLQLHDESLETHPLTSEEPTGTAHSRPTSSSSQQDGPENLDDALRLEAYHWPRLVFPPMKRSGHIILDCCTPEGKIMRLTVPKSQGKQPYYDARKSDWGDIFPHDPKNSPQVRYQPTYAWREGGSTTAKRGMKSPLEPTTSYTHLANELKEKKKSMRRERRRSSQKLVEPTLSSLTP
ncbi:hypothetical protein EW146_g1524 [Bondarzewia mesenterica]|uniref:Rsm22-domain-containing protein n=1 Tax=Bondarzewia mesenterica TaxID=1095465 RepID=A0A4S4M9R3_9AGAM|nr:hypothetical protein EW146_g1524 [Bondarzewia mesenterica]